MNVNERVLHVKGDGACLFRALCLLITGADSDHRLLRKAIATYVYRNWNEFKVMTQNSVGDNYSNPNDYYIDMIAPDTMGGIAEIVAASRLFPYEFRVIHNNKIYVSAANKYRLPVRKLLFSATDMNNGHFDAIINTPVSTK